MKSKSALLSYLLGFVLLLTIGAQAQQTTPAASGGAAATGAQSDSEEGATAGNYNIISSVEFGVRALGIDGNRNKYASDLNYRAGFRIFDSSFLARSKNGRGQLFDTLLVTSSGFDADPHGMLRISLEKNRAFKLDVNLRRNSYDNFVSCCNLAQNYLTTRLGLHRARTQHNIGDFDLKLLPQNRKIRFNLGYSMDRYRGPATSTLNYARDTFQTDWDWRSRSDEFRGGFETRVGALDLALTQGYRRYRDEESFTITGSNLRGLDLANFTQLTSYSRTQPMRGRAWYTRLSAHTEIEKKLDLTVRYIYTKSNQRFNFVETARGQGNLEGQNVFIDLNQITSTSQLVERPTHLFDAGLTWRATDKLRISDTVRVNTFRLDGSGLYSDVRMLRRATGTPTLPSPLIYNLTPSRELELRRWQNSLELDYDFGPRLSFFVGHRYIDRHLEEVARQRVYPISTFTVSGGRLVSSAELTNAINFFSEEEVDNKTNGFFAGFKARPLRNWNVYFDINRGQSDNAFTRVDNYDTLSWRVRNRITPRKGLNINVSFTARNNSNPGVADEALLNLPEFDVDIKSRTFSSSLDWSPGSRFYLATGYTYQHMTSDIGIIFLAPTQPAPPAPPIPPLTGRSVYYLRDHFFFVNANVQLHRRVNFYVGYNGHNDQGQGDRLPNDAAGLFIRSFPLRFQSPEARLVVRLEKRLDWTIGYQYFDYKEKFQTLFPEPYINENYRAHLPYTSLRLYFGRADR